MNVSLPEDLKAYVDDRVRSQGFGTTSGELIRRDRGVAVDHVYFGELRARVCKQSG